MSEPSGDPSLLQQIGYAVGGVLLAAGSWIAGRRTNTAARDSEIAQHRANQAESEAEKSVVDTLREEVQRMSHRLREIDDEFRVERIRRLRLETHVVRLESIMRAAGLEIPPLDTAADAA